MSGRRRMTRRASLIAFAVVGASIALAACSEQQSARPMTIRNATDSVVTVEYHLTSPAGQDRIDNSIVLQPHNTLQYVWPFQAGGTCAPGTLVATASSAEIARLEHPCEQSTWEIDAPPAPSV